MQEFDRAVANLDDGQKEILKQVVLELILIRSSGLTGSKIITMNCSQGAVVDVRLSGEKCIYRSKKVRGVRDRGI